MLLLESVDSFRFSLKGSVYGTLYEPSSSLNKLFSEYALTEPSKWDVNHFK